MCEPVDGYTVERDGDEVILILVSRYGTGEEYHFTVGDAKTVGTALVEAAEDPEVVHSTMN